MKTILAIHQKFRHRLNDDWTYGNGELAEATDIKKLSPAILVPCKMLKDVLQSRKTQT